MGANKHNTADIIWKSPGSDVQIISLNVHQSLSDLYTIQAEIKCSSADLSFQKMLHQEAKIVLKCGSELEDERIFGGIISRFSQGRTRHGNLKNASSPFYCYQVEIRPKLWLLTKRFRSIVFQQKTAKDIVEEILGDYGIDAQWKLSGSPKFREYCIQYEETDFNFISRLLEDDGICFFFDQENKRVIFADDSANHPPCKPKADAQYVEEISPRFQFGKQEFVSDFDYEETISTGAFMQHHYNYETSQMNIKVEDQEGKLPQFTDLESYQHTANYMDKGEGQTWVKLRMEEHGAGARTGRGTSSCRSFEAGHTMNLSEHFRGDLNVKWLLTSCLISVEQGGYRCRFTALPTRIPYRPVRKTRRPKVVGIQTAVVTGPDGAKVYLDEFGRCKLQFHWDREGGKNDRSSMWVRVSNNYAGKDYGIQWIPRVGHEVLVTFINGDPDLPIVTGRVYNDFNQAPLGPAKKWQNIIKTIKDNHILFDDKDGNELFEIRAERDMNTLVIRNDTQTIGNDRAIQIGRDHREEIGRNMSISVGDSLDETVARFYRESVGKVFDLTVGEHMNTRVGENQTLSVGSNRSETVGNNSTVQVGRDLTIDVGKKAALTVSDNISVAGNKKADIVIKDQLTVKVGKAKMILKKNGDIQVEGKELKVKASGKITMKGSKISLN